MLARLAFQVDDWPKRTDEHFAVAEDIPHRTSQPESTPYWKLLIVSLIPWMEVAEFPKIVEQIAVAWDSDSPVATRAVNWSAVHGE
jgi:hypothetical protein